jgi:hypothetical protein
MLLFPVETQRAGCAYPRLSGMAFGMGKAFMRVQFIRRILATWCLLAAAISSPVSAQSGGNAKVQAYGIAIKCFVANGFARSNRLDANDTANAAVFDKKAKKAFDKAVNLGGQLGYSNERINGDFAAYGESELQKLFREPGYFREMTRTCKAYGLM